MKFWKLVLLLAICFNCVVVIGRAQEEPPLEADRLIKLDPPGQREFVLDRAELISAEHEAQIRELADKLLTDKAAPLVIVTIDSMADHGGAGMRIETFARLLFDQWQIGPANFAGQTWNRGILLLVSKNDRRARIELGAGWGREQDALCQRIMEEQIVPRFKAGDFSGGILAGAISLEKMARGLALPRPPTPWWYWPVVLGGIALAIFTIVSLIRRGSSGWAWLFWGAVFALIGTAMYMWLSSMNRRSSGGGFSGGSFGGGGFSGGGGASGSW